MTNGPQIQRVRHELKRRTTTVTQVRRLAPKLTRVTLQSEELRGFVSLGFDDHVKVFFPGEDGVLNMAPLGASEGSGSVPVTRDFTPRSFDAATGELSVDIYLHGQGPAARWAAQAAVGQKLGIGGPRGSAVIPIEDIGLHLMIGDETALPAIERRLEELPSGAKALVVIEVEAGCEQALNSDADVQAVWLTRNQQQATADALIASLRSLQFEQRRCFAWAATETQDVRAIRRYLMQERGFDKSWIKAAGYWQRGATGSHVVVED